MKLSSNNYYRHNDNNTYYINNIYSNGVSNENYIQYSGYNCYSNDSNYNGAVCIDNSGNQDIKCKKSYTMNTKTECENKCNTIKGNFSCTGYLYGLPDSPKACAFRSHICISNCDTSSKDYSTWVRKDKMNNCSQDASSSSHTPTPKPTPHTSDICDKYGCKYRMRSDYNIPDNRYICYDGILGNSEGSWFEVIKYSEHNSNIDYPENFKNWIEQGGATAGGDQNDEPTGGCNFFKDDQWQCGYGKCTYDNSYVLCKNIMAFFCAHDPNCVGFTYYTTDLGYIGAYFYTQNISNIKNNRGAWMTWPGEEAILSTKPRCNNIVRNPGTDLPNGNAQGPEYCQNWCVDIKAWNFDEQHPHAKDNAGGNPSCYNQGRWNPDTNKPVPDDDQPLIHPCIDPSYTPWKAGMMDNDCIDNTKKVKGGNMYWPCGKGNFKNTYKSDAGGFIVYFPDKLK